MTYVDLGLWYIQTCVPATQREEKPRVREGIVVVSAGAWRDFDQKKTTVKKSGPLPILCALNINTVHKRGKVANYKMNIMYGTCSRLGTRVYVHSKTIM